MNHLDEGTIHAWLDGALDADRAHEVDAHVRDCAACSAAVGEARGLIAASSRILGALDDVPANVIPGARPAAAPTRAPRRMWRAAPWVTGIAAVLLAAVVLRTPNEAPTLADQAMKMDVAARAARSALDSMEPKQTQAAPTVSPAAPPVVASAASAAASRPSRGGSGAGDLSAQVGTAVTGMIASADQRDSSREASKSLAQPVEVAAAERRALTAEEDAMRRRVALAPPPALQQVVVTSAPQLLPPDSLPPGDVAGCYVYDPRGTVERIADAVAAKTERGRTRAAASAAAGAAAPSAPARAEFAAPGGTRLIRLDTLRGRPGFIVRSATSDSSIGWWTRAARDSARVDLYLAGTLMLSPVQRVPCP